MLRTFLSSLAIGCALAVLMCILITFVFPLFFSIPEGDKMFVRDVRGWVLKGSAIFYPLLAGIASLAIEYDNRTPRSELLGSCALIALGIAIPFVVAFMLS